MNIVAEEDLKDKFIAYAVNKSAIKVGAGNINAESSWTDNSKLTTIRMSTAFWRSSDECWSRTYRSWSYWNDTNA